MAHLTVGQRLHGVVTHVEFDSTGCYSYIQFCEIEVPDLLAEAIDSSVNAGDLTTPDCRTGDFVLALFSDDGAWYRAEVRNISGGACTVFFVDYGNTEVVSLDNIKIMPSSVGQKPPLASRCRILGNWGNENDQSIKDRLVNEEFMIEIISHSNGIFDVQLNDSSGAQSPNKGSVNNVLETLNLKTGSKHLAYISFIDSPNKFWIQLVEHENSLNGLMEDITSHVQSGPEYLKTPSIGSYCLSTFSEDEATYRSVVLTSTSGKCLVQFVDYGNSESKSASELMVLPDRFKVLPIQGIKCCYKSTKIKPNMLEDKLQELTSSSVTLTIVSKSSDSYTVEIDEVENMSAPSQNGSISVGEVKHDYPISELELNSVYDVCLSYVCHPGKFYVQLIDNAATIDEMMDLVAEEYITSKVVHHPQRGLSCLAKLSDGQFYRCMIKELKGDQVIICAVDFGFEECVQMSSLKEISTNNQSLPVQCFECTVDVTKLAEGFWSGKEVKILKELESQVPLVAKVTTVRGSVYQLDLYDTRIEDIDRYINAELLGVSKTIKSPVSSSQKSVVRQSCKVPPPDVREGSEEMVCVTAVKSKTEFYGQLTKVPINKFADLQELLSETYEVPQESIVDAQIGTYCCAKYDDGGWYRAVITGINGNLAETGFTDFGDSCTQPITSLKQLLPIIASTPQLCILCQLTNIPPRFQAEEINSLLMNKVIELKLVSKLDGVYPSFRVELTNHRNNHDINCKLSGTQAPRVPRLPNVASKMQSKGFGDSTRSSGNDAMQISIGSEEDIMVTHVIDPEHFHCQLNRMASPLDEVMDKLHTSCSALGEMDEVLEDVALGQSCAAKYSDDQVWYRAKITGLLAKGLVEVLFFDYGNTECVSRETLKKLKPEFLSLPPQAVYCGMSGLSAAQGFWSPEHIAQFEDLVLDQTFKAKFKSFSSGDDLYLVELTNAKGENVNQKFGESTHSLCQSNRSVSYGSGNGMDMKVNVGGTAEWSATGGRDRNYNRKPSADSGFGTRERSDRFSGGNRFGSNQRSEDGGSWGDNRNESRGFGKQSSFGGGSGRFGNRDSNSQGGGDDWGDGDSKGFGNKSSFGGGFNRQDRNAGSGRFGNRDNSGGGSDDWGDGESKGFGNKSSFGGGFNRQDRNAGSGRFGNRDNSGGGSDDWGDGESKGFGNKSSFSGGFNKQDRNVGSGRFGNRDGDSGGFGNRDGGSGGFGNRGGGSRGFGNRDGGGSGGFNRRDNDSDRGSGGGFGSRSGGGRGCHKCGEEGHFARECPNAESRGFGRKSEGFGGRSGEGFGGKSEGFGGRSGGGFGGKSEGFGGRSSGGFGAKSGGFGGGRSSGGFGSSARNTSGNTEEDWGGGDQSGGFGGGGGFGGRKSQDSGFGGKREGQFRGGDRGFGGGRKPEGGFGGKSRDGDNWNTDSSSGGFSGGGRSQGGFGSSQRQKGGFGGSGSSGFSGSSQPAPAEDDWGSEVDTVNVLSQSAPATDDAWQHDGADSFTLAKLKVGDCLDLFVVYSISPGQFWCQVANTSEKLGAMMDKMNEEYNGLSSTDLTIESPEIGMPCVAMFSEDELWYRAEIVGFSDNDQYEVQFVDYGNTEMVTKSKIKTVKPQYLSLPSQGVRCSLHGVQPNDSVWTEDATKQFESLTTDKTLTAKVKNYAAGLYLVDLEDSEGKINIGQRLSEEGLCVLLQDGTGDRHTVVPNPYPDGEYQEDQNFEGYVSWIDNPASFWVQPSDKVDHIEEFGSKLQEQYSNDVSSVERVSVGMAVVALYSEDGAWYRAFVERVVKDKYTVRFVDYGNSDTVELVHIRLPSPDLLKEQCQAVHCGLTGIQPLQTDSWNIDAKDIMDSLVKDAVSVHLLQKTGEVWQTIVQAGNVNIADELIGAAVVKKEAPKSETESTTESAHYKSVPDIAVGTSVPVYVSHINSLNSFYCQLSKNSDDLDQLMGKIEEYCSSQTEIACSLRNDMPCLAKFSGDEMWYRAKILQVYDGAAEVLFIDYGNSEKVPDSNIFEITNEFLNLNPQAIHCTLSNVASPGSDALSQFQNTVLDKELTMTITSVRDDIITVTLHDSGKNVEDHLTPELSDQTAGNISMLDISVGQSVEVYTSFIESPSQFYLQLAQSEEKLTEISTKLEETYANCSPSEMTLTSVCVGQICCAKYSEDGTWYRAMIESTNNDRAVVRFVDYGNSDEVDAATLKVLLPELAVWNAQAVECKLSGISAKDGDWSDSAIEQFENGTMNQKLTCVFVSSCEVSLVGEEGDVGEGLVNAGFAVKAESQPAECAVPSAEIPIGQTVTVFTSVVESPAEFFVQMSGVEDKLAELSEKLEEKFSGGSSIVITSPSIGQHCCTQYSEDGAWYRSVIENIEGDKANVRFIDYGNSEDVSLSALMVLPEEFCKEGPKAYKCKIASIEPVNKSWTDEAIEYFKSQTADQELTCTFTSSCCVQISNADGDIGQSLVSLGHATGPTESTDTSDQVLHFEEQITPSEEIKMSVSSFEDGTLYLQSEKEEALLGYLIELLQNSCPSGRTLTDISVGSHCCSLFLADSSWYRAIVTKVMDEEVEVFFVDFGNSSTVSRDNVRHLTPKMLSPPLAYKCCLSEITNMTHDESVALKSLTADQPLKVTFVGKSDDTHLVKLLLDDGRDVLQEVKKASKSDVKEEVSEDPKTVLSDSMIDTDLRDDIASKSLEMDETHLTLDMTGYSEAPLDESSLQDKETPAAAATEEPVPLEFVSNISLLKSLSLSEDDRIQVTVCHVTSPSAFFVQLNDNKSSLDTLLDEMFELYSNTDDNKYAVKVPTIGMVCAAKYSQDAAWYRGKIKKVVDDDKFEVQFLDHGNTDTCQKSDLRKLITKFAELPLQAVPCTLGGVRATEGPWSEEAVQLFSETTLDKNMLADVVRSVGDGCYLIQLLDMGISVSDTLIQKGFGVDATTPVVVSKKTKRVFSDSSDVAITPRIVRKLTEETPSIQEQEEEKEDCSLGRFKRLALEISVEYAVTISHTESPSLFWCQLNDNASVLDRMMDEIQEAYKEETTLADLGSECCIVKHSDDGLYYRAFVDYDSDTIWALLVDYGIFKEVTQAELKPIKEEFLALPAQAFLCGFSDIRPLGIGHLNWDESAVCAFEELTSEAELTIVIERVKKNVKSYVQLLVGDVSIGQELVKDGYAVLRSEDEDDSLLMDASLTLDSSLDDSRLSKIDKVLYAMDLSSRFNPYKMIQLESDSEHCVELTEMITPTLFYVHLCEDDQLDKIRADITKQMEELPDSKLAREEATEGVVCLAWSESSRTFERAKVLSVADTKVEVFFVDTGKSDSVPLDKCHHLPEALKSIPAQAVPCGLTDIESEDEKGWTTEASLFVRDYLSNTPLLHMYVHRVGKQGLHFITIGCESEDLNRLMVDLGFAKAQTNSTLYQQVHEPPSELEQSFDELSMNRQNSYGSSLDHGEDLGDVSALDTTGHSVCNCNFSVGLEDSSLDVSARTEDTTASLADESALETTDMSACQGDESVLDTTSASDSFHFVNLKNKAQNNEKKGEITEQSSSSKVVCEESSKDESVLDESKTDESILDESKEDESTEEEKLQQEVQEELKEDDPKQEEPKEDVSKMEEPKEDDSKMEEPQGDNSKMEEPQGDNSKQEEVKEEDSKMEQTKEDDSKQEEVKEEVSKMEQTKEDDSKQEERKEDDFKQEDEPKQVESKEDVFFDAEEEDADCKSSTLEGEGEKVEIKKSESDLYVNAAEFIDPDKDSETVDSSNVESNNNASGSTKSETEDLSPKVTQTGDSIGNDPTESSQGEVVDAVINESGDKPEKSHDEEIVRKSDPKEVSAEEGGNANDEVKDSNDTQKEMQVDTESNAYENDTAKVQTDKEDNMSQDTTETTSDALVISECDTAEDTEKDGGSQESTNEDPEKAGEEGEKKSYEDKEETPAED